MRAVVQRVVHAKVKVNDKTVGEIEKGLFVLLGIKEGDTEIESHFLADKISKMRVMSDEKGKMNLDLRNAEGSILVVSQFTLHADTRKGNRPSFIKAADPKLAQTLYKSFVDRLISNGLAVRTGKFGEYMEIDVHLDGPVTIIVSSDE